jgi:hypothetical protein
MNLSDRRVVAFREWAEKRFAIGSGGYPEGEDLLAVVMQAVDERERQWQQQMYDATHMGESPEFLSFLKRELS